jgi:polar amino acid transport system substrate-binding protein
MKKLLAIVAALIISTTVMAEVQFYTHNIKPFTWQEKGQVTGFATDIVRAMMDIRGQKNQSFKVVPFKRGLKMAQTQKNIGMFIVARRPEREDTVKWVGPLLTNEVYFYKKKGSAITPKTLDDIKKLNSVGVGLGNADDTFLTKEGFKNLDRAPAQKTSVQKLAVGRVDVAPVGNIVLGEVAKEAGIDPAELERTDVKLYDSLVYLVFSKDISDAEVAEWAKALEEVKATKYDEIHKKYIK